MRKLLHGWFMLVCLAMMPVLQSCDDDNDGYYSVGDFTPPLWATVHTTGNAFYLDCDTWGTLWPMNPDLAWYDAVDGQRVIVSFNPLADNYGDYDHAVKILRMREVLTKTVEELTAENDAEFGNDPMLVSKQGTGISGGYFNVFFYQNMPMGTTKHRISLVKLKEGEVLPDTEEDATEEGGENTPETDGYIHLELRYNDYDDVSGHINPAPGIVSFSLKSLDITQETKGIKIKLNSEKNGEVELVYDLKSEQTLSMPEDFDVSASATDEMLR